MYNGYVEPLPTENKTKNLVALLPEEAYLDLSDDTFDEDDLEAAQWKLGWIE
jgi:hypothetical protein